MRRNVSAALVVVVLALAGCSSGDSVDTTTDDSAPTGEETTTSESTATGGEAAVDYIEALATYNPSEVAAMIDLAEPGSFAHSYAIHQTAVARAGADSGLSRLEPAQVTVNGDEIEICDANNECSTYENFETDPDSELVTDFTINGIDADDRLVLGDDSVVSQAGVDYKLISAYISTSTESLFVAFDVTNNAQHPFDPGAFSATYVGADGRQVTAADAAGALTIQPGATATVLVIFDGADLGGAVQIEGYLDDPNFTITNHQVPIPAP